MERSMFKIAYPWGLWDASSIPSREWEVSMTCPRLDHFHCSCCNGAHSVASLIVWPILVYGVVDLDVMFHFYVLCHCALICCSGQIYHHLHCSWCNGAHSVAPPDCMTHIGVWCCGFGCDVSFWCALPLCQLRLPTTATWYFLVYQVWCQT